MKHVSTLFTIAALAVATGLVGCKKESTAPTPQIDGGTLAIYFSGTDSTRAVSQYLLRGPWVRSKSYEGSKCIGTEYVAEGRRGDTTVSHILRITSCGQTSGRRGPNVFSLALLQYSVVPYRDAYATQMAAYNAMPSTFRGLTADFQVLENTASVLRLRHPSELYIVEFKK